jgi:hypothetical protein
MYKMIIHVVGGLISEIEEIPEGVKVEIHDYDISEVGGVDDLEGLRRDSRGGEFYLIEWN